MQALLLYRLNGLSCRRWYRVAAAVLAVASLSAATAGAEIISGRSMLPDLPVVRPLPPKFAPAAAEFEVELAEKVMPYWYDTAIDRQHGGYLLADSGAGLEAASSKMVVTQARMIWGFAHAYRNGIRDPERDYLAAAAQGYRFLLEHFLDEEHGGYYWRTDLAGAPLQTGKSLYGQAFVVYALVEYYRASGVRAALDHAVDLYRAVQAHLYDVEHGGWRSQARADWQPPDGSPGLKDGNSHLHWLEAVAELFEVTRSKAIRSSFDAPLRLAKVLREALRINATYFYPLPPERSVASRAADWGRLTGPRYEEISYGHLAEFAWLMIRAERILGQKPSWRYFHALMSFVLSRGYDRERGGTYRSGFGDEPAVDTEKVWWVQAETLAALSVGLERRTDAGYRRALTRLLRFLRAFQIDPQDGIWFDSVAADGTPLWRAKAHEWKANYHDLRAI